MSIDESYNESVRLYIDGQNLTIKLIDLNIKQLEDEICLKSGQLALLKQTAIHEKKFLTDYLETVNL